jgi:hypothetical protein
MSFRIHPEQQVSLPQVSFAHHPKQVIVEKLPIVQQKQSVAVVCEPESPVPSIIKSVEEEPVVMVIKKQRKDQAK